MKNRKRRVYSFIILRIKGMARTFILMVSLLAFALSIANMAAHRVVEVYPIMDLVYVLVTTFLLAINIDERAD